MRATLIIATAIPVSLLSTFIVLEITGRSLNVISLAGLAFAVGMVLDAAIVVLENILRMRDKGLNEHDSAEQGAGQVWGALLASTATTLAAFLPLLFWPGMPGEFMRYLPLTLIFTLSSSFLMALIFMPTLGSIIGKKAEGGGEDVSHMAAGDFEVNDLKGPTGAYVRLVDRIIRHPVRFSSSIVAGIIAIIIAFVMSGTPVVFFPEMDPESIQIHVHARGNLSLDERRKEKKERGRRPGRVAED